MQDPLSTMAGDAALAKACLANAGALGDLVAGYRGAVAERDAATHRHRAPIEGGLWNAVTHTDTAPDRADEVIARTLEWFGGSCRWWTGPWTRPSDLDTRLRAAGFEGEPIPGMVCDLASDWDAPDPPDLHVERVEDRTGIDAVMAVFEELNGSGAWVGQWADVFAWFLDHPDRPVQVFVGTVDGRPVTCGWMARGAGVAGIYGVQTLPEMRGHGFGAALTRAPMRAARAAGDRVAVLQSAPLAAPLYRRIGYRQVCELGLYER
jgi:GNAT superfamily N-acetyltransferase